MDDPFPWWWLALAGSLTTYLFTSFLRVAFRLLGPVSLEALVERLGPHRTEFLRKSLWSPTPFWFALQLITSGALLACLVVLFAGGRSLPLGDGFALQPTGSPGHDAILFGALLFALVLIEFAIPVLVARLDPEQVVERCLPLLRMLHVALSPATIPLARVVADDADEDEDEADDEELDAFIDVGTREGILEGDERELVRNVVIFGDTRAREVMTPRTDIVGLGADATIADLVRTVAEQRRSRLPVFRDTLDDIVGVATLKDAVQAMESGGADRSIESIMRRPCFVPETKLVSELLREMQEKRQQLAVVIDEYGGTAGVVTIEDLLEELVGEIREEHELEPDEDLVEQEDGTLRVRGVTPVHDLEERLGSDISVDGSATVGGLLMSLFNRVPHVGDAIDHAGHRFEVVEADDRRILTAQVRPGGAADDDAGRSEGRATG